MAACPYPACAQPLVVHAGMRACGCELRNGLDRCGRCGVLNRTGAVFCRGCRERLPEAAELIARPEAVEAEFIGMEGAFRRPPLEALGALHGVTTDGRLMRLSLRPGAEARQVARLSFAAAGYNGNALVDAAPGVGELRGWTYLAVSPNGVEAVSLATILGRGKARMLFRAEANQPLAVNAGEDEAGGFRGLAANGDLYGFGMRTGSSETTLMVRYFSPGRPAEQPLSLAGRQTIGPVLCGTRMLLASDEEIGCFDTATGRTAQTRLPGRFTPLLTRSSSKLNVVPGSVPLTMIGDAEAVVGGFEGGRPGLLQVRFADGECSFRPLAAGTSLTSNPDGSLCANVDGDAVGFGCGRAFAGVVGEMPRLEPGMPVVMNNMCYGAPYLVCFAETPQPGEHDLQVRAAETGALTRRFRFVDAGCNAATCCGIAAAGLEVAGLWLDLAGTHRGQGLRVAHGSLAE